MIPDVLSCRKSGIELVGANRWIEPRPGARTTTCRLGNHPLRSHGGLGEHRVPFFFSRPLMREYRERAETGMLRNHDIFDFALNGVE